MFALVSFITPPAQSFSVRICWKAESVDIVDIHTRNVSNIDIEFHWGGGFPIDEVMPDLQPYKRENKNKTNLHFDVEYYYIAFPDVLLEIVFVKAPEQELIETIDKGIDNFVNAWNSKYNDKIINYVSPMVERSGNGFEVVADMGTGNSIKTIGLLLEELSGFVPPDVISKVTIR